jgi:hypothetical protein
MSRNTSGRTLKGPAEAARVVSSRPSPLSRLTPELAVTTVRSDMPDNDGREQEATLSDVVVGDATAIDACLNWLQDLNRQLMRCASAMESELHSALLGEAARAVALASVRHQAREFAKELEDDHYKTVVSGDVVAWVAPMLAEAARAAHEMADAAGMGPLAPEAGLNWLRRIKAPKAELQRLHELLVLALVEARGLRQPTELPNNEPVPSNVARQEDDNSAWLTPRDLAARYGVDFGKLDGRLRRWRKNNPGQVGKGFSEVSDRTPTQPQFLYRVGAVWHILDALRAPG